MLRANENDKPKELNVFLTNHMTARFSADFIRP
jgi:hypothetical protein